MKHMNLIFSAAFLASALASPAWAGGDGDEVAYDQCLSGKLAAAAAGKAAAYDEASGRNLLNYPKQKQADFQHMKLELFVADMNKTKMEGVEHLTLKPLGGAMDELDLEARVLEVKSVMVQGHKATFKSDGDRLAIRFEPALPADKVSEVVISYSVGDQLRGLFWTPESPAWPGRAAQIHTQGEPETNSYWFPCHDFPNAKLTTEIVATVPKGYTVSSNGKLMSATSSTRDGKAYDTFRWLQDKPHSTYLVSFIVGKFDVVNLGSEKFPVQVYAPVGHGEDARKTYANTPEMIEFFGKRLGRQYAWDKYSQLIVHNFMFGGMENTSATTMHDTAYVDDADREDRDLDGLISHELGHQWFGDLMTCNSWEHIWLNEGWATYMTGLWDEHHQGKIAYDEYVRGLYDGVIGGDRGALPETPGMCSKVYDDPFEPFQRGANPYGKGASILAMLRAKLGEDVFFKGVAEYIKRCQFGNVETNDFRRALEDVSGETLAQFFKQWCERPNVPRLNVRTMYDAGSGSFTINVEQTQQIDGLNPAFEFTLPVWVKDATGATKTINIDVHGKTAAGQALLGGLPVAIALDPELTTLFDAKFEDPAANSLELVKAGPTFNARSQAIRRIGQGATPEAKQALVKLAENSAEREELRVEAIAALRRAGAMEEIDELSGFKFPSWRVRRAVVESVGRMSRDLKDARVASCKNWLKSTYEHDTSEHVRTTALNQLGDMKDATLLPLFVAAANTDSLGDDIRHAAIQALRGLNTKEALDAVKPLANPGHISGTRPSALGAVAAMAKLDPEGAYKIVAACLYDHEGRTRREAGHALVVLGDPRGVKALEQKAASTKDSFERWETNERLAELKAKLDKGERKSS